MSDPFRPADRGLAPQFSGYPPSFPPMSSSIPVSAPARPPAVWVAVVALGVAALGALAQVIVAAVVYGTADRAVDRASGGWGHPADHYRALSGWGVMLLAAVAVVCAIGYGALAFCVWRGMAWPRYAVSVVAAFSLFGLLGGPVILVIVVAGILAAVMLWLPSAHNFCTAVALAKAPRASNPFAQPTSSAPSNPWQR